jgi:predicted Fe-Mo cluster-binding NifX family protein
MAKDHTRISRLHLEGHCIHCAAKRRFQEIVDRLIESKQPLDEDVLEEFETLRRFLSGTDFEKLQREIPRLTGDRPVEVTVAPSQDSFSLEVQPCGEGIHRVSTVDLKEIKQTRK